MVAYENTDGGAEAAAAEGTYGGAGPEPGVSDSMRTFGAFVQGLREHAGLSREELGELVHFSKHTVASVELGRWMSVGAADHRPDASSWIRERWNGGRAGRL